MAFPYEEAGIPVDGEGASIEPSVTEATQVETDSTGLVETETATPSTEGTEGSEPTAQYFDPDQYRDHLVKVKVDGEEIEVPLSEALNGYSRTADYTRKTQQLAEIRKQAEAFAALQQALQTNPQGTLQALSAQLGFNPAQQADPYGTDELSAEDQRLLALQQQVEALAAAEADRALQSELNRLKGQYGDLFDPDQVVQAAVQRGVSDIREIETVFKQMTFDKILAEQQARAQYEQQQTSESAARAAAAEHATAVVSDATGVAGGTSAPTSFDSLEAAFEAAAQATGFVWD